MYEYVADAFASKLQDKSYKMFSEEEKEEFNRPHFDYLQLFQKLLKTRGQRNKLLAKFSKDNKPENNALNNLSLDKLMKIANGEYLDQKDEKNVYYAAR